MAKRWAAWAAILLLAATLAPASEPRTIARAQPEPDSWQTYEDVTFGYTIAYPTGWEPQVAFENPPGQPHIVRQRVAFRSPQQAQVEIDVWDRDPALPMDQWFSQVQNITTTVEINALVSGQDAYLRVQPGGCGVPTIYAAYVPYGHRVYEISHPSTGDLVGLSAFDAMLRSFALHAVDPAARSQTSLPDYLPSAPLTCGTNICPSTCWGECTFAAISEGCCGYHPVPKWQCAKECVDDQPGDFEGNCVWWGAYTRPDVGEWASGNADNWADSVRSTGQLPIDRTPKVGDIVVHPGTSYNHVAYVVWVSADRTSYIKSDMGWCGDCDPTPDQYDLHTVDADDEFIHCAGDPPIPTRDWQFTDCPFGWTPGKGFAASQLDGYAWGFDPAVDPFLLSPILDVPADEYLHVMVRIFSHAADTTGTIYFTTDSSPGFDEAKSVDFAVTNDGAWHDIIVDMTGNPNWQGTITRLRVDPVGNGNADSSYDGIGIDRIRFLPMLPELPEHVYLPLVMRRVGSGEENQPPYEPKDPWPPDGAVDQLPPILLTWTGGDPDEDEVTYDVYLDPGDVAPLTPVCEDLAYPACDPGALFEDTNYTWQVLATDARGAFKLGPIWELHTAPASCVNVVGNGGFEDDSDWVLPSTAYPARYSTAQARNGSRSMQVGIIDPAQDKLSYSSAQQVIAIPSDAESASLRFWLYTQSDEPEAGTSTVPVLGPLSTLAEDAQYVFVYDSDGNILRRRYWQPPLDDRAWTEYSIDLSAFAGQTVKLYFGVYNDGDGAPTGMYVDEVTLVACPP
ncbi:MAG: CHAP domain-containing protein [Anaerolineae bacterium]|jgi:hypothetical protein